jgi:predicted RNA binding protein YcfA (HicA-like mRNA interferase family)
MPQIETNTRRIIAQLLREGWRNIGGGRHDVVNHPDKPIRVVVPRHREQKPGRRARSQRRRDGSHGRSEPMAYYVGILEGDRTYPAVMAAARAPKRPLPTP